MIAEFSAAHRESCAGDGESRFCAFPESFNRASIGLFNAGTSHLFEALVCGPIAIVIDLIAEFGLKPCGFVAGDSIAQAVANIGSLFTGVLICTIAGLAQCKKVFVYLPVAVVVFAIAFFGGSAEIGIVPKESRGDRIVAFVALFHLICVVDNDLNRMGTWSGWIAIPADFFRGRLSAETSDEGERVAEIPVDIEGYVQFNEPCGTTSQIGDFDGYFPGIDLGIRGELFQFQYGEIGLCPGRWASQKRE